MLWLFDLDDTLHDASTAIFPAIHDNMNAYITLMLEREGCRANRADVAHLRHDYWLRYGATLIGVMRHYGVAAKEFLDAAHRFENLKSMVHHETTLRRLFQILPGRKVLLTNAPANYTCEILELCGLQQIFSRIVTIEAMRVHGMLRPKPSAALFQTLLQEEAIKAHQSILVEDTLSALKTAKSLGMRTIWVTGYSAIYRQSRYRGRPAYVDYKVKSVLALQGYLRNLEKNAASRSTSACS